jgi:hypothetical protein
MLKEHAIFVQGQGITIITNFARVKIISYYLASGKTGLLIHTPELNITINALDTCYAASFYLCPSLEIRPIEVGI